MGPPGAARTGQRGGFASTIKDEKGLPRRKAATTIDTATAEEDVKDFDVPEKNLTGFDQVLLQSVR